MIYTGIFGRKKCEDKINRLAVDRPEINGFFQAYESTGDAIKTLKSGMGQSHTVPHACRPQAFALLQSVYSLISIDIATGCDDLSQLLE